MSKHTPGPWFWDQKSNVGNMVAADRGDGHTACVATFQDCTTASRRDEQEANREANGRLIAAAPDLLVACKAVWGVFQDSEDPPLYAKRCRDAIAKAEGQ